VEDEFMYLDSHLTKLTKIPEVERFKYYVKKRITFYLYLLKSKNDKITLNKYAMSLVKKIAKRLDSQWTKIYRYIRKGNENAEKYLQRSTSVSRSANPVGANISNSPSLLKERTVIHLKRYLAKIPPKNIEELLAFNDLFKDRMKAEKLENLDKNVKNIKNTISFRIPGYTSPLTNKNRELKTEAEHEANRHLERVIRKRFAGRKIGSEFKRFSDIKKEEKKKMDDEREKDRQEKLRKDREGFIVQRQLLREALSESAKRQKENVDRRKRRNAAVRLQSMHRMRSDKKAHKRDIVEKQMFKAATRENAVQKSLERREVAFRKGQERKKERERIQKEQEEREKQKNINKGKTEFEKFIRGNKISNEARERAAVMAIENALQQPHRPVVHPKSTSKSSSNPPPYIVFVPPNGKHVNLPRFNVNDPRGNKQKMIVVRAEEETYRNMLKRLGGDVGALLGYY
tara:strand:- start:287 stop:1660 length:1374 start_codon:yes stop_codon:yes gene_type:complete